MRNRSGRPALASALVLFLSACGGPGPAEFRAVADREEARRPDLFTNGEARAWQVRRDGTVRGLLWGTLHLGYGDDTVLPGPVRARFYAAADLTVEVVMDRVPGPLRRLASAIRAANLAFDPEALGRLDEQTRRALADVPGTGDRTLSLRGLAGRTLAAGQAAAPASVLPEIGITDASLVSFARQQDRPVHGLEQPEVIDPTVADPNGPDAAAALRMALRRREGYPAFIRWLRATYSDGDVAGFMAAVTAWQAAPDDLRRSDRDRDIWLGRRNAAWLPRLDRLFRRPGDHFVAVGAGHLVGQDGLVALLRDRGYQVSPCSRDDCR